MLYFSCSIILNVVFVFPVSSENFKAPVKHVEFCWSYEERKCQ